MQRIHNFFLFILVLLFAGCSPNVPLGGKVTYTDDGSPLHLGYVVFLKDGKIARANIKEDGTFIVGYEKEGNGLPPGTYQVYITDAVENLIPLIETKYASSETSGLTLIVDASTKTYDIKVDRYSGPRRR